MKELQLFVEQYDILIPEIEDGYDNEIRFKNGSFIKVIKPEEQSSRGKRASFDNWMFDFEGCMLSKEQIDEVLKPFCKEMRKDVKIDENYRVGDPNRYIPDLNKLYVSSKDKNVTNYEERLHQFCGLNGCTHFTDNDREMFHYLIELLNSKN
jgi:hypothetical protein